MRTFMSSDGGCGFPRHIGARRSWAMQSVTDKSLRDRRKGVTNGSSRYARYLQLRRQRRYRGVLWATIAMAALFAAWDLTCRLDEVTVNTDPRSSNAEHVP